MSREVFLFASKVAGGRLGSENTHGRTAIHQECQAWPGEEGNFTGNNQWHIPPPKPKHNLTQLEAFGVDLTIKKTTPKPTKCHITQLFGPQIVTISTNPLYPWD